MHTSHDLAPKKSKATNDFSGVAFFVSIEGLPATHAKGIGLRTKTSFQYFSPSYGRELFVLYLTLSPLYIGLVASSCERMPKQVEPPRQKSSGDFGGAAGL